MTETLEPRPVRASRQTLGGVVKAYNRLRHECVRQGLVVLIAIGSASGGALFASAQTPPPSLNSTGVDRAAGPYKPVPQQPIANDGLHRLIVANDLGMHCAGFDSRISSILPPYNVLHAQVIRKGAASGTRPALLDNTTVGVEYSAVANPNDPVLAQQPVLGPDGSVFKTNFWSATSAYAPFYPPGTLTTFFPSNSQRTDIGLPVPDVEELFLGDGKLTLNQATMPSVTQLTVDPVTHVPTTLTTKPYVANAPQPFQIFETSYPFFKNFPFGYVANNTKWFSAEGIPIVPFDDVGRENPYPLMRVVARDKSSGNALVSADAVVPISGEANCKGCHLPSPYGNGYATGRLTTPTLPSDDPTSKTVPAYISQEWAAQVNILKLHDVMHGTRLFTGYNSSTGLSDNPIVCQSCHYTPALDLAQQGPAAFGMPNTTHETMSRVLHYSHGMKAHNGTPIFPTMPPANDPRRATTYPGPPNSFTMKTLEASCYQCHPGQRTQCLRGAMFSGAGAVCQDCHGQMTQVGDDFSRKQPTPGGFILASDFYTNPNTPRVPWANEPTCGSCHTGDAASNLTGRSGAIPAPDGIRLLQAYLSTDAKATPILPTNMRFAEPRVAMGPTAGNPQLFRLSVDTHGGVFCEGCHGPTHAEWPRANPNANDNVAATQIQGHVGKIMECDACHTESLGRRSPARMACIRSETRAAAPAIRRSG